MNPTKTAAACGFSVAAASVGNGYASANAPSTAPRESHVPQEVSILRQSVTDLCNEFDAIAARLVCVSSPMPCGNEADEKLDSFRVPLAEDIRNERRRVQNVLDAMRRLSMALEV